MYSSYAVCPLFESNCPWAFTALGRDPTIQLRYCMWILPVNILDSVTDVELKVGILCLLEHGQPIGGKRDQIQYSGPPIWKLLLYIDTSLLGADISV